ncbi:hypothetical protein DFH11DRAFT_1567865 [Phellopilus nigrolimitatus]|nr:hypothetical protein DFH11DRAFT_1567865 [Phellopilus nigrolimitatus]
MNFTNINASVSALLDQLRASQAWADLQAQAPESSDKQSLVSSAPEPSSSTSVASLLSQLSSAGGSRPPYVPYEPTLSSHTPSYEVSSSFDAPHVPPPPPPPPIRPLEKTKQDVRKYTFQQSLPYIAQLSDDPAFIETIAKLRRDQDKLEKRLWEERQAVHMKQAERVKAAVTKANILGTGISEHDANTMRLSFEKELHQFDRDNVMPIWEGLVTRQQVALETLGVPAMFTTSATSDRERQQRVVQVLEGITGGDETPLGGI